MDSLSSIVTDTSQLSEVLQLMGYLQGSLPWILILVASAAVMQLVTIVVILTGKKGRRGYQHGQDRRPGGAPSGSIGKPDRGQGGAPRRADGGGQRKPGDNNKGGGQRQGGQQGGRPQQERGGRPGSASIDPMEMSLRDINQRLKNAEREQDSARRNMRDGDGIDGDGRGRNDRQQQRGGRDGRGGGGGGGNRDDRGPRRDPNPNRDNRGGRPERQDRPDGARPPQDHGRFRQNEQGAEASERPQTPEIVPNDMGVPDDQLQHGRRFTAKRRTLPDDSGTAEEASQQQYQPAPESAPTGNSDSFSGQERQNGVEDIQFGR